MKKYRYLLPIWVFLLGLSLAYGQDILITGVLPDTIDDANLEYIELTNFSRSGISLSGFSLKDKSGKIFQLGSGSILASQEVKRVYRPESKIILNNTDEELWLFDPQGALLDHFSYAVSVKDVPILTGHRPADSSSGTASGSVGGPSVTDPIPSVARFISTGAVVDITSSGARLEGVEHEGGFPVSISWYEDGSAFSGSVTDGAFRFVGLRPDTFYVYILRIEDGSRADAPTSTGSFTTAILPQQSQSGATVGSGEIPVDSGSGDSSGGSSGNITGLTGNLVDTGSQSASSGQIVLYVVASGSLASVPDIVPTFQIPTYLRFLTGAADGYECDRTKPECKLNLSLLDSFTGGYDSRFYSCTVVFSGGETIDSCNPDTRIIPLGPSAVTIRIMEKADSTRFKEKVLHIMNQGPLPTGTVGTASTGNASAGGSSTASAPITSGNSAPLKIPKAVIHLQGTAPKSGWVDGGMVFCILKDGGCTINFDGSSSENAKYFEWSFGNGMFSDSKNPKPVRYQKGIHTVRLKVTDGSGSSSEASMEVHASEPASSPRESTGNLRQENARNMGESELPGSGGVGSAALSDIGGLPGSTGSSTQKVDISRIFATKIRLQSKQSKNLSMSGKAIACLSQSQCKVNLGISTAQVKGIGYFWDFGNSIRFFGSDPKTMGFKQGKYTISLVMSSADGTVLASDRVVLSVAPPIDTGSQKKKAPTKKAETKKKAGEASSKTKTQKSKTPKKTASAKKTTDFSSDKQPTEKVDDGMGKALPLTLGFTGFLGIGGFFLRRYTKFFGDIG